MIVQSKTHRDRVAFHCTDYQIAHGHAPRGRGSWAFFKSRVAHVDDAYWAPPNITFVEAKKYATRWAQDQGVTLLYVGS